MKASDTAAAQLLFSQGVRLSHLKGSLRLRSDAVTYLRRSGMGTLEAIQMVNALAAEFGED